MKLFSATLHVNGNTIEFLGDCWEEGGFHCDDDGNPRTDNRGNTVANYTVSDASEATDGQLRDAYAGEGEIIRDFSHYLEWLTNDAGISAERANLIVAAEREWYLDNVASDEDAEEEDGECKHENTVTTNERPFYGPVADIDHQNPAAHGNIEADEFCLDCGALRGVLINGRHLEHSEWRLEDEMDDWRLSDGYDTAAIAEAWRKGDYGTLHDSETGESIRPATADEAITSYMAGPDGHIEIDGRTVYVQP